MINHLTFISHYIPCRECVKSLLAAAPEIKSWGNGGLQVFNDGHVISGYATGDTDNDQGTIDLMDTLDTFLSHAAKKLCHSVDFLVWLNDEPHGQASGPDYVGPIARLA